jgi:hypothetical protein
MNYGLGSNDHVEKYIGLIASKIDRVGDRYYVYIPNLLQYDGMLICWNQTTRYYWLEDNSSYGQYMPLQAGTAVAVEFYDKDYNTGYIVSIVPGTVTSISNSTPNVNDVKSNSNINEDINTANIKENLNGTNIPQSSLFSSKDDSIKKDSSQNSSSPTSSPQNKNRPSITTPPTNIAGQRLDPNDRDNYNMLFKNKNMSMFTVYENIKATQFQKVLQGEKKSILGDNGLAIDDRDFKNHLEFHYLGVDLYTELPYITLKSEAVIRLKAPVICLDGQVFVTGNVLVAGTVEENKGLGLLCTNGPFDKTLKEDKTFEQRMQEYLAKITAPTGGGRGACWDSDVGSLKTHHATGAGDVLIYFWCKGATYVDMDDGCYGTPTRVNRPTNFICPI